MIYPFVSHFTEQSTSLPSNASSHSGDIADENALRAPGFRNERQPLLKLDCIRNRSSANRHGELLGQPWISAESKWVTRAREELSYPQPSHRHNWRWVVVAGFGEILRPLARA